MKKRETNERAYLRSNSPDPESDNWIEKRRNSRIGFEEFYHHSSSSPEDHNSSSSSPPTFFPREDKENHGRLVTRNRDNPEVKELKRKREDKIRAVNEWYQRGLKKLLEPNENENENENDVDDGKEFEIEYDTLDTTVTCYFFETNQFNVKNGKAACSAISLFAVFNFLRLNDRDVVKDIDWKSVINAGAKLWINWRQTKKYDGETLGSYYQDVHEAYSEPCIQRVREKIKILQEIGGHLDDRKVDEFSQPVKPLEKQRRDDDDDDDDDGNFCYLSHALTRLKVSGDNNTAGTFTARDTTVSIFFDKKFLWLFDSHGGIKKNHSSLFKFRDEAELCDYLRYKNPIKEEKSMNSESNLFSLIIFQQNDNEKRGEVIKKARGGISNIDDGDGGDSGSGGGGDSTLPIHFSSRRISGASSSVPLRDNTLYSV